MNVHRSLIAFEDQIEVAGGCAANAVEHYRGDPIIGIVEA